MKPILRAASLCIALAAGLPASAQSPAPTSKLDAARGVAPKN